MKRLSRSKRYKIVREKIKEAYWETRALKEELQSWLDNMPENLKYSERAHAIEVTIDQLFEVCDSLDNVLTKEIYFPGAYD